MRSALLLAALAAAGCAGDPETAGHSSPPLTVRTAAARVDRLPSQLEAGGTVRARTTAVLSSRVMSSIVDVAVDPGDRVRAGQVLVRLDARQFAAGQARADASLAAAIEGAAAADADAEGAAAALSLARVSHERIARLAERKVATPAEIDAAVAALRGSEARMKAAEARKAEIARAIEAARATARNATVDASYTTIAAPFDAVVTARNAEPGNMAMPGAPLLTIEDLRRFRLEVSVDAADTTGVAVGSRLHVTVEGLPLLEGMVEEVTPAVDAVAHAYVVKIALPDTPGIRSGLYGRARFRGTARETVTVPASAIVRRGQLTLVFVDDGGTARLRYVHAGTAAGDRVPILAGVAEKERVVVDPPAGLADGARVAAAGESR